MSRNRTFLRMLAIVALLSVTASASAAEEVLLRCRFKQGEKYRLVTALNQDIDQRIGDRAKGTKQTVRVEMGMEALEVADEGAAELKVTCALNGPVPVSARSTST